MQFWKRARFTVSLAALAFALGACETDTVDLGDGGGGGGNQLPPPAGLAAVAQPNNTVDVSWGGVTGASSYRLERTASTNPGVFTAIGGDLTALNFTDNTIQPGITYGYRVAAANLDGVGEFSSAVTVGISGPKVATLTGIITSSRTLFTDTTYTVSGYVKVANNSVLTVQAGTTVIGDYNVPGSSLWILRGSRIEANGTAASPIVFTSSRPDGSRKPGDWGGLIIIGNGVINRTASTILTEGPAGVGENYAGGTNNADNSGTLRYVRVEFAGYDVSAGAGQELNALSMYAVGSGTVLEYVQTLAGLDDSFEWWGGAVNGRYLISYESGDDHFDWSEGYRGKNQFLIGYQNTRLTAEPGRGGASTDPQGFEADGCGTTGAACPSGFDSQPFSLPVFTNFTVIGGGTNATRVTGGDVGMVLRRGTAGYLSNGILARWPGQGISIRDAATNNRWTADSLNVANMLFAENGSNFDPDASSNFGKAALFAGQNVVTPAVTAASLFQSLDPANLNWTPAPGSPAATGANVITIPSPYADNFFGGTIQTTTYFGAADPAGPAWWAGWTRYATN